MKSTLFTLARLHARRQSARLLLPLLASALTGGGALLPARAETLYQFTFPQGTNPNTLAQGKDGALYVVTQRGGAYGHGVLLRLLPGHAPQTVYDFGTMPHDGYYPTGLVEDRRDRTSGGSLNFYGTTRFGGVNGFGTVFKIVLDRDGKTESTILLHSFSRDEGANPAALVQASDSTLYGSSPNGGAKGYGTLWAVPTEGGQRPGALHTFTFADGANPDAAPTEDPAQHGTFYGVTRGGGKSGNGTVYRFTLSNKRLSTLHSFSAPDGYAPSASLVARGGKFYGVTETDPTTGAGTLFSVTTTGQMLTLKYFDTDTQGSAPDFLMLSPDGALYGTTAGGGASVGGGSGSVFRVSADNTVTVLSSFPHNVGASPTALAFSGGTLYGTAMGGSIANYGAVFHIPLQGGAKAAAALPPPPISDYAFSGPDGSHPVASLVLGSDGFFYGSTSTDGTPSDAQGNPVSGAGTLFRFAPNAESPTGFGVTTLHSFRTLSTKDNTNEGGAYPQVALVEDKDKRGTFYSTTEYGGPNATGTVYQFVPGSDAVSTEFDVKHWFTATNPDTLVNFEGAYPAAPLLQIKGLFYGTALYGGADGSGTVFVFDPLNGSKADNAAPVHTFTYAEGAYPAAGLIADKHNNLYGTTGGGGEGGYGSVFRLQPDRSFLRLHSFTFDDGAAPQSALALGQDTKGGDILSGTTFYGGTDGFGTTFQVTGGGGRNDFSTLHSFTGGFDGGNPQAALLLIPNAPALAADGVGGSGIHIGGYRSLGATYTGGGGGGQAATRAQAAAFHPLLRLPLAARPDVQAQSVKSGSAPPPGGVVFSQKSDGTNTQQVVKFGGRDGSNPASALVQGADGYYYGTTEYGGAGAGTIYRVALPQIDDAMPKSPAVGTALTVSVAGSGFVPGSQVYWNGTALPTVVNSTGRLTAHLPASVNAAGGVEVQVGSPDGKNTAPSNEFALRHPINDNFADRTLIKHTSTPVTGSNAGASFEPGEPSDALGGHHTVWYTWTAPQSGPAEVYITGGLDSVTGVYTGSAVNALTAVAGRYYSNDAQFTAKAGVTYQISVDGNANVAPQYAESKFNLSIFLN